ncbi:hypothetical protein WN51_10797 [Melipona quadrifasciata]|uniref:Uncharacterized protein n=1 Tax=Melipona quadrifasciata TaxID=166423 RepID=A0A0N0BI56_9HYME|nr:hypothetical protein WN51_10797 [Melipona quadrifasciata]
MDETVDIGGLERRRLCVERERMCTCTQDSTVINQELVPSGHFTEVAEMRTNDSRILRLPPCRPTVLHAARLEIEKNKLAFGGVRNGATPGTVGLRFLTCPYPNVDTIDDAENHPEEEQRKSLD